MQITFVRHTAVDVEPGVCYGISDVNVKPSFPEEASVVKGNIEAVVDKMGKDFDAVFSSPLTRCRMLADYCGYPEAVSDNLLLEMNFGEWEMQRYDDIKDPRLQQWFDDWINVSPPGGESFANQNNRVRNFIDDMKNSGYQEILVFCHAGIIMNAMLIAGSADINNVFNNQPSYGSLTQIDF